MPQLNGKCPICLGHFVSESISALLCGHTFHYDCIRTWLKTSRTCPECRVISTERALIRQLYFNDGGNASFFDSSQVFNEEAMTRKIAELKEELGSEQNAHAKTGETLHKLKQEKERLAALLEKEKKKSKSLTSRLARMEQLELMLQDQQNLEKELERCRARLKASELYTVLAKSDGDDLTGSKIDKYLDGNGEPNAVKFLELMRKQNETANKSLREARAQLDASHNANHELRIKLAKHKKLVVALREEVNTLSSRISQNTQVPANPQLAAVLLCSPEARPSMGFDADDNDVFTPTLMKSALKARGRPVPGSPIKRIGTWNPFPSLFDENRPSLRSSEQQDENRYTPFLDQNEEMPGTSGWLKSSRDSSSETERNELKADSWDAKVPAAVMRRACMASPKKKSNGLGGTAKIPLQPIDKLPRKRVLPTASRKRLTKQKSANSVAAGQAITAFFKEPPRKPLEASVGLDDSIVWLD